MTAGVHHLRPATELAERVLLPADPHWALAIAQQVTEQPRMFNHARGLWGYTGTAADGRPMSIQSTGIGGASTAVICEELIELGARRLVRVGACAAVDPALELGALLAADRVVPGDGASRALGASPELIPDPVLHGRLVAAGAAPLAVASSDLFTGAHAPAGVSALDMEAAALLAVAARHGVAAACALGVTRLEAGNGSAPALGREEVELLAGRLGELGRAALGA